MKFPPISTFTTKGFLGIFALLLFISFDSSAKKVRFLYSAVAPATQGYVKISQDKYNYYIIKIRLSNLKESYRLKPPKLYYVVWVFDDKGYTMDLGRMDSSIRLLTKKLKASFKYSTEFKPVRIFITAEDDLSQQYPGTQEVLTTDII